MSQQAEHDVPHLLMPAERAEEVLALVKVAVGELGRARTPGMAAHALASALRLVHEVEAESQRERATAVARVERAYEQMEQAREELRGIRHSRSWRYTRLLRRVTDR